MQVIGKHCAVYIRDVNICGVWSPQEVLEPIPVDSEGQLCRYSFHLLSFQFFMNFYLNFNVITVDMPC